MNSKTLIYFLAFICFCSSLHAEKDNYIIVKGTETKLIIDYANIKSITAQPLPDESFSLYIQLGETAKANVDSLLEKEKSIKLVSIFFRGQLVTQKMNFSDPPKWWNTIIFSGGLTDEEMFHFASDFNQSKLTEEKSP
jgi:hypothetical protein